MNYRLKHIALTALFFVLVANACAMLWILARSQFIAEEKLAAFEAGQSAAAAPEPAAEPSQASESEPEKSSNPLTWIAERDFKREHVCYAWTGLGAGEPKAKALLLAGGLRAAAWIQPASGRYAYAVAPSDYAKAIQEGFAEPFKQNDALILGTADKDAAAAMAQKLKALGFSAPQFFPLSRESENKYVFAIQTSSQAAELQELARSAGAGKLSPAPCPGQL